MKEKNTNSTALSEVVSVILVIALVLVLAMVVYVLLFGSIDQKYLKKSVYVAGSAQETSIPSQFVGVDPYQLLTFSPKAGDPFYLTGQETSQPKILKLYLSYSIHRVQVRGICTRKRMRIFIGGLLIWVTLKCLNVAQYQCPS